MYAKRRTKVPFLRMVRNALTPKGKRALTRLLDRISKALTNTSGGNTMVHEYTGCQFSDSYGYGIEPRSGGRRRGSGLPVSTENGTIFHVDFVDGQGAPTVLPASGTKAIKRGKTSTGDRHTGRRRVRDGAAQHTPERKTVPVAYAGKCGYAHTAFPSGRVECSVNECYAAYWPAEDREAFWLDIGRPQGADQW